MASNQTSSSSPSIQVQPKRRVGFKNHVTVIEIERIDQNEDQTEERASQECYYPTLSEKNEKGTMQPAAAYLSNQSNRPSFPTTNSPSRDVSKGRSLRRSSIVLPNNNNNPGFSSLRFQSPSQHGRKFSTTYPLSSSPSPLNDRWSCGTSYAHQLSMVPPILPTRGGVRNIKTRSTLDIISSGLVLLELDIETMIDPK
eukprot:CAMPEP_0168234220 /NCGR_PEP_ID=MMETSP0140_2-20121125/18142_1 /TAXON_ID=44445 /ORGANISM="Pseudo-nitzschia australis, Strain 10249 10 AB" /LENGTH=197 /DNA_ID=CAMNT_0008166983 /DNA_START=148 /DNA_END=741 /DNA_ORIENTATION=-